MEHDDFLNRRWVGCGCLVVGLIFAFLVWLRYELVRGWGVETQWVPGVETEPPRRSFVCL